MHAPGNTKGGSITVPLTSCLTGLDESVLQIKTKIVSCHTDDSKQVKQEVNGAVRLPPLVFPGMLPCCGFKMHLLILLSFAREIIMKSTPSVNVIKLFPSIIDFLER
jgi:hypothetical protein